MEKMEKLKFYVRSVTDKDNYANYFVLPLLSLTRRSFGADHFINCYTTVNGKIAVLLKPSATISEIAYNHPNYLTDFTYKDNLMLLYSCPKEFEDDLVQFMSSKFSRMSDEAKALIFKFSGLSIDFPNKHGIPVSSRLIQVLRRDGHLRDFINKEFNTELGPEDELEPLLREQDILYDIDADITFVTKEGPEYAKRGYNNPEQE